MSVAFTLVTPYSATDNNILFTAMFKFHNVLKQKKFYSIMHYGQKNGGINHQGDSDLKVGKI